MKVGDKVRIRRDSNFHNMDNYVNPHNDVVGTVIGVYGLPSENLGLSSGYNGISVQWPNATNIYRRSDLEIERYTITKHKFI